MKTIEEINKELQMIALEEKDTIPEHDCKGDRCQSCAEFFGAKDAEPLGTRTGE